MKTSKIFLIAAPLTHALAYGCGGEGEPGTPTGTPTASDAVGDADGDGISDADEGKAANVDTDGDGNPDYLDLDSDDDGIDDSVEGGDGDLNTAPVDSDG
ncbi:MAG: hypothetical protein RIF41_38765, partial [Polyangiaceae bacterium]